MEDQTKSVVPNTDKHQTTPHTQSQANVSAAESDLEPDQRTEDVGRGGDAELYANSAGAQTAGTRSAHVTNTEGKIPPVQSATQPVNPIATDHSKGGHGITNAPIAEEDKEQEKLAPRA